MRATSVVSFVIRKGCAVTINGKYDLGTCALCAATEPPAPAEQIDQQKLVLVRFRVHSFCGHDFNTLSRWFHSPQFFNT
jgi:hypothetical protein